MCLHNYFFIKIAHPHPFPPLLLEKNVLGFIWNYLSNTKNPDVGVVPSPRSITQK